MKPVPLVCIVDDRADYRLLLQKILSLTCPEHSLSLFTSGEALLEAMTKLVPLPSFVLLDRQIPGIGGYQTLLRLKEHSIYRQIPVIMMSAQTSEQDLKACYQAGANSFVRKPLDVDGLAHQLRAICQYWFTVNQFPLWRRFYFHRFLK